MTYELTDKSILSAEVGDMVRSPVTDGHYTVLSRHGNQIVCQASRNGRVGVFDLDCASTDKMGVVEMKKDVVTFANVYPDGWVGEALPDVPRNTPRHAKTVQYRAYVLRLNVTRAEAVLLSVLQGGEMRPGQD